MISLEFNQNLIPTEKRLSSTLLLSVQKYVNESVEALPEGVIAAAFISDQEMQNLNKKYREKDKTTDVLAFSYLDDKDSESLGDVVISYEQAELQAKEGVEKEVITLLVHGTLHVLGYDHINDSDAEVMLPLQDKIVAQVL